MYIAIHEYHFVFINTPATLLILLYLYDADCCDTVLMYVIYLHGLFEVETAVLGLKGSQEGIASYLDAGMFVCETSGAEMSCLAENPKNDNGL